MMWLEGVQLTSSPDRSRGQEVVAGRQMGLKLWAGKEERRRGMGGAWEDPGHSVGLSHLLPAASGDPEEATAGAGARVVRTRSRANLEAPVLRRVGGRGRECAERRYGES